MGGYETKQKKKNEQKMGARHNRKKGLDLRSSQRGPSLVAQVKPCLIVSLTVLSNFLSTCSERLLDTCSETGRLFGRSMWHTGGVIRRSELGRWPEEGGETKSIKKSICWLTSVGSVSSCRMLGPRSSGPKAQMFLAARRSHPYFSSKNFAVFRTGSRMLTVPSSMSSAMPLSSGSANIVILFCLFGVMA